MLAATGVYATLCAVGRHDHLRQNTVHSVVSWRCLSCDFFYLIRHPFCRNQNSARL